MDSKIDRPIITMNLTLCHDNEQLLNRQKEGQSQGRRKQINCSFMLVFLSFDLTAVSHVQEYFPKGSWPLDCHSENTSENCYVWATRDPTPKKGPKITGICLPGPLYWGQRSSADEIEGTISSIIFPVCVSLLCINRWNPGRRPGPDPFRENNR